MSIYFEKARELGNLILESDYAKAMEEANEVYLNDETAKEQMSKYQDYYAEIQKGIQESSLSQEEVTEASKKLSEMVEELKAIPSMAALIYAEGEFNDFVTEIMNILRLTITGKSAEEINTGCGGSCGGCSGCGPR
ncbi:YlbF family regulator [Anaeropeptidivorans aminofermentans]|jgi:cell fate (sporulation/competence/biofilm development) regulator YlbF (YheA/YmcA/DUF963 family)|uniref:YlbF family regulator n=1 Tax=Anaeropeptidivorans aminofermentans TaxID=2934315 RepID=UPI002025747B|nr:YlbF family regulator [Anaeropeptidivorans aminofermentans]